MSATMVLLNLLGAIVLLLWGLRMVRTGVQRAFGGGLRRFLGQWLSNRVSAFTAGFGVTALLQSSTATCLMTADFASRGMISLAVALGIMLGADVGTSVVAQIFALDISWLSPLLLLCGFVAFSSSERKRVRSIGRMLIGLGLVLLALKTIVGASEPLRNSDVVLAIVGALDGEPLLAILIAAILTWAAHSSLAIVLLVCSLAATGAIPVSLALILVLGANLGAALPPLLATMGRPLEGRRVAIGNGIFKLTGVIIALPLISSIQPLLAGFDPDPVRMAVNLHTGFNLALAIVFLPLTGLVSALVTRLLPDGTQDADAPTVRYLDRIDENTDPSMALGNAAREVLRMGDTLDEMLKGTMDCLRDGDALRVADLSRQDDVVDELYEAVKLYLTDIRKAELEEEEARRCGDIMAFCTNLEHIGDIIDKNLLETARQKIKKQLRFSDEGLQEIEDLHNRVHNNLRLAMNIFVSGERPLARKLLLEKEAFRDLEAIAAENHLQRLQMGLPETRETSALHLDIIRDLKRVNSHLTSVAYPILDEAGELRSSRLKKKQKTSQIAETPAS